MAFEFAHYINGSTQAREITMVMKDAISVTLGDMVEVDTSEADFGVSGSTTLLGVSAESVDNAADGESLKIIDGFNAVFSIVDANARVTGAALDINGTYDGVTTDSNSDVVVVEDSTATEKTLVMIRPSVHIFTTAT